MFSKFKKFLMLKSLLSHFPNKIKKLVHYLLFTLRNPKLLDAKSQYAYTDEHLKFVHLLECMNYLKVAGHENRIPQVYFEFGCHSGRTFSSVINAANYLGMKDTTFFAFDSFSGLPQTSKDQDGIFQEGEYSTSIEEFKSIVKKNTGFELSEGNIIKGFYNNSLSKDLQRQMSKVGVVHIDVDLYSSTVEVLEFIKPLIVTGSILVFDDWYCFPPGDSKGEKLAFEEFLSTNEGFEVEEWKNYSTFGKSFFVTSTPD